MSQKGPVPSGQSYSQPGLWSAEPFCPTLATGRKAPVSCLPSPPSSDCQSQNSTEAPPPGHWGLAPSSHLPGWKTTDIARAQAAVAGGAGRGTICPRIWVSSLRATCIRPAGDQGGLGMGEARPTLGALTQDGGATGVDTQR